MYVTGMMLYKYILLTKCEVKMAGYWPSSLFAFLWTETKIYMYRYHNLVKCLLRFAFLAVRRKEFSQYSNSFNCMLLSSFSSFTFTYRVAVSGCFFCGKDQNRRKLYKRPTCIIASPIPPFFGGAYKSKTRCPQSLHSKDYNTLKTIIN